MGILDGALKKFDADRPPPSERLDSPEKIQVYVDATFLTKDELLILDEIYQQLDRSGDGELDLDEFRLLPELIFNPFSNRIMRIFTRDGNGTLSFLEAVELFSVFSPRATMRVKARYAFCVYDFDEDGYIGVSDMENTIKRMSESAESIAALLLALPPKCFFDALSPGLSPKAAAVRSAFPPCKPASCVFWESPDTAEDDC